MLAPILDSFAQCAQANTQPDDYRMQGLHSAFAHGFPFITSHARMTYETYRLDRPRHDVQECLDRGLWYAAPIRAVVRLFTGTPKERTPALDPQERVLSDAVAAAPSSFAARQVYGDWLEERGRLADAVMLRRQGFLFGDFELQDIKEQEIYFSELPLMLDDGTFIVDGERRAVLVREEEFQLPTDAAPMKRVVLPGDAITLAFAAGLAKLKTAVMKRLGGSAIDTYMPHDLMNLMPISRAFRGLLTKRATSTVVSTGNIVRAVEAIRSAHLGEVAERLALFAEEKPAPAAKMIRLALPLVSPEPPRIITGIEQEIADAASMLRASHVGTVARLSSTDRTALVWPSGEGDSGLVIHSLTPSITRSAGATLACNDGDVVTKGTSLSQRPNITDGRLALGREALVIFDPKAREVVVSEDFAATMMVREIFEAGAELRDTRWGPEELAYRDAPQLDALGIVREGVTVRAGDILVGKNSWQAADVLINADARVPADETEGPDWFVRSVELFARIGASRNAREDAHHARRAAIATEIQDLAKARGDALGTEVAQLAADLLWQANRSHDLPLGVIRIVRIALERARPLTPGNTLGDRRGYAVEVSRLAPASEMPQLSTGERADIVLPAKKAPVGTRREAQLGLAARKLGQSELTHAQAEALPTASEKPTTEGALYVMRR